MDYQEPVLRGTAPVPKNEKYESTNVYNAIILELTELESNGSSTGQPGIWESILDGFV